MRKVRIEYGKANQFKAKQNETKQYSQKYETSEQYSTEETQQSSNQKIEIEQVRGDLPRVI